MTPNSSTDGDALLTHEEAASYLRLPQGTLYQLNYKGGGPRRIRVGRNVLYRKRDIDSWLDTRAIESGMGVRGVPASANAGGTA
ncbi:helix-turn-helix transcriptional regulator [Isoptericola sp. NPDC056578]|uniref:helix-turn-helix transcriptional regulator n=1 Tax=Isoptericola sp. NPDC056578 TaxID=3345870 RepID=UPI00368847E6